MTQNTSVIPRFVIFLKAFTCFEKGCCQQMGLNGTTEVVRNIKHHHVKIVCLKPTFT